MSLMNELNATLKKRKANEVESAMTNGGLPPEGVHHAMLKGQRDVETKSSTTGRELLFVILAGPGKGQDVKDTLWNSDKEAAQNRKILFAHRLGLLRKVGSGDDARYEQADPKKQDFNDVRGTCCFIEVVHEEYEKEKGGKGKSARLSFEGIINPDDKRVKGVPTGSPPGAGPAGATAANPSNPPSRPTATAARQTTIDEADAI